MNAYTQNQGTHQRFVKREVIGTKSQSYPLMHDHNAIELVRVDEGVMDCVVCDTVNRLETGDFCLINANRKHQAKQVGNEPCTYSVMYLNPTYFTRDQEIYNRYIAPVFENKALDFVLGKDCRGTAGEICRLMDEISALEQQRPPAYELEVIALAHIVFKQVYLRYIALAEELNTAQASSDSVIQRKMTSFIYEHFSERISLEDIATAGGVSRSKCSNVFREQLDTTPIEFLNRYRLEAATHMLSSTQDSIARIATACGFTQQSYFNRVFMKEYGMTPKQYRKTLAVA
ncbi:MAG: helix-turn-helix transcriptional regulator [Atopobiaceae bacterium]|nr:helix-turn-helix transcriptional regulator [Atopobiaceae bacterium]